LPVCKADKHPAHPLVKEKNSSKKKKFPENTYRRKDYFGRPGIRKGGRGHGHTQTGGKKPLRRGGKKRSVYQKRWLVGIAGWLSRKMGRKTISCSRKGASAHQRGRGEKSFKGDHPEKTPTKRERSSRRRVGSQTQGGRSERNQKGGPTVAYIFHAATRKGGRYWPRRKGGKKNLSKKELPGPPALAHVKRREGGRTMCSNEGVTTRPRG